MRSGAKICPRGRFVLSALRPRSQAVAAAADYPNRPVRFVVGFPPGGSVDITARLVGQFLAERLGQQFVIDNRPGAGSNIGTEAVVNAPADGYTLLLCGSYQCDQRQPLFAARLRIFARHRPGRRRGCGRPTSWWSTSGYPQPAFPSSSPMPRPIPAASTWPRRDRERRRTSPASCSKRWPASTWSMCPIAATRRR